MKVYYDLMNCQNQVTEPPIVKPISTEELKSFNVRGEDNKIDFSRIRGHTQAIERTVKTVTEALRSLCLKAAHEGFIKDKIESRKLMQKCKSKKNNIIF